MAANLDPLKALVKLVAHAVSASVKAAGDSSASAKIGEFQVLIPDVLALLPQIGSISLSGLAPADYVALVEELASDLSVPDAHAAGIINASLKLIADLVPDVEALVAAIKAAPVVVAPPAA